MGAIIALIIAVGLVVWFVVVLVRREQRNGPIDPMTGQSLGPMKPPALTTQVVLPYILCYALFAILFLASLGVFLIWREAIVALLAAFANTNVQRFLYLAGNFLLIITLSIVVLASERYLRGGVEQQRLGPRFLRGFGGLLLVGAVGFLIRMLAVTFISG